MKKSPKDKQQPAGELRRLQFLFEHCARNTGNGCDFTRLSDGSFQNKQTQKQFELWRSGYEQGVVDQAVMSGQVEL